MSNATTYYKSLRMDLGSWHDKDYKWPIGEPVTHPTNANGKACGVGLDLFKTVDSAIGCGSFPCRLFEAECLGEVVGEDDSKVRTGSARLTCEIFPAHVVAVNDFVASLAAVSWFAPKEPAKPEWRVFDTRAAARDAAWDAARAAAWAAAWAAARDAAWAAAWDAAWDSAWAAAWAASRAAARDAAWAAAWDAARAAAWAAAWDAALMARVAACTGLPLDAKHIAHAKARWEVWQRGYGLHCEIDGVLYVYRRP